MATHITIHFVAAPAIIQGSRDSFTVKIGQSLMQGATHAGVEAIAADCGGSLTCATCHIYVDTAWADKLPAPSADELSMLEMTAAQRQTGSRLSCQILASQTMDGMEITLPETQY
jgi:ferredoxin, 2Fe-2S